MKPHLATSSHKTDTNPDAAQSPTKSYATAAERIRATGRFNVDDIQLLGDTHLRYNFAPGSPWDDFKNSYLDLPPWFRFDLDPMSQAYELQQRKLWGVIAGVDHDYDPEVDEKEPPLIHADAVRFPGYFVRRDARAVEHAAEHVLATGMLLKHAGVQPGQWAIEYGAGFAQTALHFARLGVNVDTVDISEQFCKHVKTQADFYKVPLTAFRGQFGWNPRGLKKYDLIWFYESFHHCVNFKRVVHALKRYLAASGRILLAGEPIPRREDPAVPYPWGLRLHSEVVAVVRARHWFELGFTEDFIVSLFTNAGFVAQRIECPVSKWGEGYIFQHRGPRLELAAHWLPIAESEGWYGAEPHGRWTRERACLSLDASDSFAALEVEATNHHPLEQSVELLYGETAVKEVFRPGERKTLRVPAVSKAPRLTINCRALCPAKDYKTGSADSRALGIFVHSVAYV